MMLIKTTRLLVVLALIFLYHPVKAQTFEFHFPRPHAGPDTNYYHFTNGVQMIEIDYFGPWVADVDWHEATQPRALSWDMVIHPPSTPNQYFFRDSNGYIFKAFNSTVSLEEINRSFKKIPISKGNPVFPVLPSKNGSKMPVEFPAFHQPRFRPFGYRYNDRRHNSPMVGMYYRVFSMQEKVSSKNENKKRIGMLQGLIDSTGKIILPLVYDDIAAAGNCFLVKQEGRFGIIDSALFQVVPLRYDEVGMPAADLMVFSNEQKPELIYDASNRHITRLGDYDWIDQEKLDDVKRNKDTATGILMVKVKKDGEFGFIDARFKQVVAPVYQYAGYYFRDGLIPVVRNNKWGFINTKGIERIPCIYEDAISFENGKSVVRLDGKQFCIDTKGNICTGCNTDYAQWKNTINEWRITGMEGLNIVRRVQLEGVVDASGKVVVPLVYDDVRPIRMYKDRKEYYHQFLLVRSQDNYGIIDRTGKIVLPLEYSYIAEPNGDVPLVPVTSNGKSGIADTNYRIIIPCRFETVNPYSIKGKIIFSKDKLLGWMNMDMTVIVPPVYESIGWAYDGCVLASRNNRYGMLDTASRVLIPFLYEYLGDRFHHGLIPAKKDGKWSYIDTLAKTVIPPEYEEAHNFTGKVAGVKRKGKWGFIDRNNQPASAFVYDHIAYDYYGPNRIQVMRNGKIGLADESGNEVVPCIYDELNGYNNMGYHFRKGKEWMYIKSP